MYGYIPIQEIHDVLGLPCQDTIERIANSGGYRTSEEKLLLDDIREVPPIVALIEHGERPVVTLSYDQGTFSVKNMPTLLAYIVVGNTVIPYETDIDFN